MDTFNSSDIWPFGTLEQWLYTILTKHHDINYYTDVLHINRAKHLHAVVSYMPNILWRAVRRHRSTVYIHRHQPFVPLRVTTIKHNPSKITTVHLQDYKTYTGFFKLNPRMPIQHSLSCDEPVEQGLYGEAQKTNLFLTDDNSHYFLRRNHMKRAVVAHSWWKLSFWTAHRFSNVPIFFHRNIP